MSAGDFLLKRWLAGEFLGREKRPAIPNGLPLHAYRCNDGEFRELQTRLISAFRMSTAPGERYLAGAFCLYAAEWWRRNYDGGYWAWEPIFASVEQGYDHPTARALTLGGLDYWQRPLRRYGGSRQFLVSLVLEGGFPLRIVEREHGRLRRYLIQVLDELDRAGGDAAIASVVAEGAAATLPISLRHKELYEIVGQLLAAIVAYRKFLPDTLEGQDPVHLLDLRAEGWRDRLPLSIDDGPARSLIQALLRESVNLQHRSELLSSLCFRGLSRSDESWRSTLGFTLDGKIAPALLSDNGASIQDARRARLLATGTLAEPIVAPLALLRPSQSHSEPWRVEPLAGALRPVAFPFDQSAEMAVIVDGKQIATSVIPGGSALLDEFLVFQEDSDVPSSSDGDEATDLLPLALRSVATGSMRSRRSRLFVAIDSDNVEWQVALGSSIQPVGSIEGSRRRLFEVRGSVTFTANDDEMPIRVSTSVEAEHTARLLIAGKRAPWRATPPDALTESPRFFVTERQGRAKPADLRQLRWRRCGDRVWQPMPSRGLPLGANEVALVDDGALVDRVRFAILPGGARIDCRPRDRQNGLVTIEGISGALVTIDHTTLGSDVIVERKELDSGSVEFAVRCHGTPPPNLHVGLRWQDTKPISVELPFPVRGAGFVDANGAWLSSTEVLSVDQLYGVRGRALGCGGAGAPLFGELHAPDIKGRRPFIWRPFRDELSLSSLKPTFHRLLAASRAMDAEIRLAIDSGKETAHLRLRRFDFDLCLNKDHVSLSLEDAARLEREGYPSIEVAVRSLAAFSDEEVILQPLPGDNLAYPGWHLSAASNLSGPRLLYGRVGGRYRIRPRILPELDQLVVVANEDAQATLGQLVRILDKDRRFAKMTDHFHYLARDLAHQDWREIDATRDVLQGRLPLATLDYFDAMIGIPEAVIGFLALSSAGDRIERVLAMDDELPFLWVLLPTEAWTTAFERYRDSLMGAVADSPTEAKAAAGLVADQIGRVLNRIVAAEPVLVGQAALVREHLGLPVGDGAVGPTRARAPFVQTALREQLADIREECLRHNDEARWPPNYAFRDFINDLPPENLVPGAGFRTAALDAPYAAAAIAACGLPRDSETMQQIREFREFDPAYFDGSYGPALVLNLVKQALVSTIA